jgi:serine/threonine protein kinase
MIEPGTLLQDRFLIEEQIGVGGMGAVYLAVDQKFGTRVAVKETFYSHPNLAEAFEREARLLNGLHHPLFPHVSDHFVEGNGHFLVMEYIEGEDLSALLKRGERFPLDTVMRWTLDLLDGLDYLHSQDPPIIHRDVKPSNLKLTPRGNLLLLDFGMAKETSGSTQGMQSVFGYSRRYSPLEQIEGTGTDVRSDIFSLGATVYHLLTGTPPVDVLARASAIVAGKPDPLRLASEIDSSLPELIAAVIHSALALNPDKRFISVRAMWNAIEEALQVGEAADAAAARLEVSAGAAYENFPALKAFECDAEHNNPTGPTVRGKSREAQLTAVTSSFKSQPVDRNGVPVISARDISEVQDLDSANPGSDIKETDVSNSPVASSIGIRGNLKRDLRRTPLFWAPILLLVLGLFAYGLYERSYSGETVHDPPVSDFAPAQPANESTETLGDDASANNSGTAPDLENASAEAETVEAKIAEHNDSSVLIQKRRESPAIGNPDHKKAANSKDSDSRTSRPAARSNGVSRRFVRSGPAEPPVSSIESILSGIPDRSRQRRQWEIWEEEELRRQRWLRRQIRQNRLQSY